MGLHLTNKNSSELIHNVIMQSNPFGIPMKTEIEERGSPFRFPVSGTMEQIEISNAPILKLGNFFLILQKAKIQADLFAEELGCLIAGSDNRTIVDVECLRDSFEYQVAFSIMVLSLKTV